MGAKKETDKVWAEAGVIVGAIILILIFYFTGLQMGQEETRMKHEQWKFDHCEWYSKSKIYKCKFPAQEWSLTNES